MSDLLSIDRRLDSNEGVAARCKKGEDSEDDRFCSGVSFLHRQHLSAARRLRALVLSAWFFA